MNIRFGAIYLITIIMLVGGPNRLSWAEPQSQEALVVVESKIHSLLKAIESSKTNKNTTDEQKIALVNTQLGDVVDFERIARRVMAKHFKKANTEQKQRFLKVFKDSLLNTYAKGLWEFNDYKVNILPLKEGGQTLRNTQVSFEVVTSSGQVFPITQSLFFNAKEKKWMVQNVIINGINMGVLFRDQFSRLVVQQNGDLDLAIRAWTSEIAQDTGSTSAPSQADDAAEDE